MKKIFNEPTIDVVKFDMTEDVANMNAGGTVGGSISFDEEW